MPTGYFVITLRVKAHWKKSYSPQDLFDSGTEWIGEPKNSNGCVIRAKFSKKTSMCIPIKITKKGVKSGFKSRNPNR
jgi:hypothetical protein